TIQVFCALVPLLSTPVEIMDDDGVLGFVQQRSLFANAQIGATALFLKLAPLNDPFEGPEDDGEKQGAWNLHGDNNEPGEPNVFEGKQALGREKDCRPTRDGHPRCGPWTEAQQTEAKEQATQRHDSDLDAG